MGQGNAKTVRNYTNKKNKGSSGKSVGDFFIFISPATYKSVFLTSDIPHPLTHKPFSV
jgi:hypothetical protein